jgi:hypothetical protein
MASGRVGDMTVRELKDLIDQTIDRKLAGLLPRRRDERNVREILDSINRLRWTPPPGSKSNQELLREDRDR